MVAEQRWNDSDPGRPRYWPVEEGSYVARHWNGELGLGTSFWVNGVLFNIVFGVLIFIFVYALARLASMGVAVVALWILLPLSIAIGVWQLVGVWRSAENHKHFTGRSGWAIVAQVIVVLGWLGLAINTFDTIGTINALS